MRSLKNQKEWNTGVMDIIKSKDNNKIKYVRSLNTKKTRDEEKAFIVEGIKFVKEAIKEKAHIIYLIFSEGSMNKTEIKELVELNHDIEDKIVICQDNVFNSIADTINAQGVLAVIKRDDNPHHMVDYKFIVYCDRIQDPGNLGTIIRTLDAFGPGLLILNKGCVDLYNPKVVRASAGAIFRVPFINAAQDDEMLQKLKSEGFVVISTVVESDVSFENIEKHEKICVVIGNEGQGVSWEIRNNSHMNITIKMSGNAESLNASIAAGISIYEIRKKLL